MLRNIQVLVGLLLPALGTSSALPRPDDYYGSDVILDGYCDEAELLVEMFTLPREGRVTLTGNATTVSKILAGMEATGVKILQLVLQETMLPFKSEPVDLSSLQTFEDLQQLWIFGAGWQRYEIVFKPKGKQMMSATRIHIFASLTVTMDTYTFFHFHTRLEVLDLRYVQNESLLQKNNKFFSLLKSNPLKILVLQQLQKLISQENYEPNLNLSEVFFFSDFVTYLDLSKNSLRTITQGLINIFPKLKVLDLSYNNLLITHLNPFLYETIGFHPNIQVIHIDGNGVSPADDPYSFKMLSMRKHSVSKRSLSLLPDAQRIPDPNCFKGISMNDLFINKTQFCHYLICELRFSKNFSCELVPSIEQFIKIGCAYYINIPVAPKLHQIKLNNFVHINPGLYLKSNETIWCFQENALKSITVSSLRNFYSYFDYNKPVITGLQNLEELKITSAETSKESALNLSYFSTFNGLRRLFLGNSPVNIPDGFQICKFLPHLKLIDLSSCDIKSLPNSLFSGCRHLHFINLSLNFLTDLPLQIMDDLDAIHSLSVELSDNILDCHCHEQSINTLDWILKSKINFINRESYHCFGHNGIEFLFTKDMSELKDFCSIKEEILQAVSGTVTGTCVLFISVILSFVLWKRRFCIKTWYYKLKLARHSNRSWPRFDFDIYLSYCMEDRHWTECVFSKVLENLYGFNCCIPNRDFPAHGTHIEIISDYISRSQITIVVLSKAALKTHHHYFERNMARNQELMTFLHRKVFYVILEDLGDVKGTDIQAIIDAKVGFPWPNLIQIEQIRFFPH